MTKYPAEIITITFDFSALATSISNPIFGCVAMQGRVDSSQSAMWIGSEEIQGTKVLRKISGGQPGNVYRISCQVDDADGERWVLSELITVHA